MAENIDLQNFDWEAYENGDVTKVGQTKEELTAKYDNTLNAVKQGEVVKGIVKAINKREVIVSVGFKSDGIVPAAEFRYNPDLKVGDEVEVYVVTPEDKNGQLELSHKQARAAQSWDRVNEALANEEIVKGFIKCRTKGGMIV
ncbi:MAG: S1 RNA-binding domain-containing protein, partial [Paludibacteraceae bacterium]|nr:S1 RNA-binding domain-containing protein [Paludibacteraceae bacterium]